MGCGASKKSNAKETKNIDDFGSLISHSYKGKSESEIKAKFEKISSKELTIEEMKLLAQHVGDDPDIPNNLLELINKTKESYKESDIIASKNAISVLNFARFSFSGLDLANIKIPGALLEGSIFHRSSLSGADLSNADLRKSFICDTDMTNSNLTKAKFEISNVICTGKYIVFGSFSDNEQMVVVCLEGGLIEAYLIETCDCIKQFNGHTAEANCAVFCNKDKNILSAGRDCTIKLWDFQWQKCIMSIKAHDEQINEARFLLDNVRICSCSDDDTIKIWDCNTEELLHTLKGHDQEVINFDESADGKRLVTISNDQTAIIWDLESYEQLARIHEEGEGNYFRSVAIARCGTKFVTGGSDYKIKVWNAQDDFGKLLEITGHNGQITGMSVSFDNQYILATGADDTMSCWTLKEGKYVNSYRIKANVNSYACYSLSGKQILCCTSDLIKIFDSPEDRIIEDFEMTQSITLRIEYSEDDEYILTCQQDGVMKIWNIRERKLKNKVQGHKAAVTGGFFFDKGQKILSASLDSTIKIWKAENGECLHTFEIENFPIKFITLSPSKETLTIIGTNQPNPRIYKICLEEDKYEFKLIHEIEGHDQQVTCCSYHPKGQYFLTSSYDESIKVWDLDNDAKEVKMIEDHNERVRCVAYSHDGKFFASGSEDNTIKLYDSETYECLKTLEGHSSDITSLEFSPNGEILASCDTDTSLFLWNLSNYECIDVIKGHVEQIKHLKFSHDGNYLSTCSSDMRVCVYFSSEKNEYLLDQVLGGNPWFVLKGSDFMGVQTDNQIILLLSNTKTAITTTEG